MRNLLLLHRYARVNNLLGRNYTPFIKPQTIKPHHNKTNPLSHRLNYSSNTNTNKSIPHATSVPNNDRKWGTLILGTSFVITTGLISLGTFFRLENPVHQFSNGCVRFSRSVYSCLYMIVDYKISIWGSTEGTPEYKLIVDKFNQRSAERVLELCLTNGGVYIKAGQYIASLNHIVPQQYVNTLKVLQDKANSRPYEDVVKIFEEDLGHRPEHFFSQFEKIPIAAASLAQVHYAKSHDGKECAVKIQYPDLRYNFTGDMLAHEFLLKLLVFAFPTFEFRWLGPEIRKVLVQELDFVNEGKNSERAKIELSHNDWVYVPKVYWDMTSKRILTAEFIHGCKVNDVNSLKEMNIDKKSVVECMIKMFSEQIFVWGFLHSDPHPGNILVRKHSNKKGFQLCLLDHGFYRELDENFRKNYCSLYKSLVIRDEEGVKFYCGKLGITNYKLFADTLLMRRFEGAAVGLGDSMTKEMFEKMSEEFLTHMPDLAQMLKEMPRHLLLILRNNNLLRALNYELGSQVNRFSIMVRYAVQGISHDKENKKTLKSKINSIKEKVSFEIYLKSYEFFYVISKFAVKILLKMKLITIPYVETVSLG